MSFVALAVGKFTTTEFNTSTEDPTKDSAAASMARKRRIELRSMQRSNNNAAAVGEDLDSDSCVERKRARMEELTADPVSSEPKPSITGIKLQHRYDPGVNMTRDELKSWRKEARRVRNRESAAASRQKNRERITELEDEVDVVQSKYSAALKRIVELEASSSANDSFTPTILRQDLRNLKTPVLESRPASPQGDPIKTVSPPMSPATSARIVDVEEHSEEVNKKYQHIMDMISRPAVKISGAGTSQDPSDSVPTPSTPPCDAAPDDGAPFEACTRVSNSDSDTNSDVDESDLGEFLLDTFESMEAQGVFLSHIDLPGFDS